MMAEPFKAEHVDGWGDLERARLLQAHSPLAYTIRHNSEILICAGAADMGAGRGLLWSFITDAGRRHPFMVHRAALRFVSMLDYRRLEATCLRGHAQAGRWLERLGFVCETPNGMKAWAPDGTDHDLYALVKA